MKLSLITTACLFAFALQAQDIPKQIPVPPPHSDPNVQFTVLNIDLPAKDQFSILYYYQVSGSLLSAGEFVQDTGLMVFKDDKWKELIPNSGGAVLIKRQIIDITGKEISTESHLLALRKLDPQATYKLYFQKNQKNPVVLNRSDITKSIYNVQDLPNMTEKEQAALVKFCAQFIPLDPDKNAANNNNDYRNKRFEPTIVDDFNEMKKQLQAIRGVRQALRGDLPRNEKVQTRFRIAGGMSFAVTLKKEPEHYLKFYLSVDDQTFDCLDSAKINGDVLVTSVAEVSDMQARSVGAFTNFHYKLKDDKGEEISRQYSFVMDAKFNIHGWIHSTGKDKLNSLSPELCWFEDNKLFVLSDNREKIFKPYAQVHQFTMGGEAKLIFPATEEEKGTEKTKYANTFQPMVQFNSGQVTPVPEKYVPLYVINSGTTRYFISEGVKYNEAIKTYEYLTVKIYRFEPSGKLTNIDVLSDYRSNKPFPLTQILKKDNNEYFLLEYPVRVQLLLNPEKIELTQLTDETNFLLQFNDDGMVQKSPFGSVILKKQSIGNKMKILFYPQ